MNKKMYLLIILFAVFCSLSVVYAMGAAPPAKTQEISSEAFAPGTYKIYKNDDLGFSFKYPKEWYLTRYEKLGFYYYYLSNLAKPGLPSSENEVVRIKIFETRLPDHEVQTKEEIIKKAIEGSLKRLGMSKIELYMLHAPDHRVPFKESLKAFKELQENLKDIISKTTLQYRNLLLENTDQAVATLFKKTEQETKKAISDFDQNIDLCEHCVLISSD